MSQIKILDEATVSKIAAGEVIERPASVVKELVENSLDAGATDIRIRIDGAGKHLIEVIDNGCGIGPEDLKLAFVQHATSKIGGIADLEALETMGFRGEALASIASVADIDISTRTQGADTGYTMSIRKGRPGEVRQTGRNTGTTITVSGLFSGHPARLKYLKSDRVEVGHIIQVVTERALANPGVAFRLLNGDVEVLNLPRAGCLADRIGDVMGRRVARELVSIETGEKGISVKGHLAKPTVTKATRGDLYIFVNSRPVSSSLISEAIERGYSGLLMRNRHPVGVLMLELDPRVLDVNVHPTKRKVRFADEGAVARFIEKAVVDAIGETQIIPEVEPRQKELFPVEPAAPRPARPRAPQKSAVAQSQLFGEEAAHDIAESHMLPHIRVIGQILDTFILCQSGADLMIIDQHAAHERVMLDRLKAAEGNKKLEQKLITPLTLTLGKRESQLLEHYRPVIEDFGFKIEPFGKDTYLVRAVPAVGCHIETEHGLLDLIDELADLGKSRSIEERRDEIRHLVACHSAIRAGERLTQQRMARLVEELHGIDDPYTCAHGRPTIVRITKYELEKLFKRVV